MILGTIAYLDSQQVDNLLASIEGGLVEQFVERVKETKGKKGGGGVGIPGTGVGLEGSLESVREEAREATRKQTSVSRLAALRRILIENEYVPYINAVDEELHDALDEGELMEVHGHVSRSSFEEFIDMAVRLLEWSSKYGDLFEISEIDEQTRQQIRYLGDVTNEGIAIRISPDRRSGARRAFDFACILDPENLRIQKQDLSGKFNLLGRVKRVLESNEVVYPYELIPGFSHLLPRNKFKALVEVLSKGSSSLGFQVTEEDLRLKGPTVVLTPIAMYS